MNVGRADVKDEFDMSTNVQSKLLKRKGLFPGQSLREKKLLKEYMETGKEGIVY